MPEEQSINKRPSVNTDQPIKLISEDELGRAKFAESIAKTIINKKDGNHMK